MVAIILIVDEPAVWSVGQLACGRVGRGGKSLGQLPEGGKGLSV